MNTTEIFQKIEIAAKVTRPTIRYIEEMNLGDVVRQGDIYIERIKSFPEDAGKITFNTQLAIGQTQGSRHIIYPRPKGLVVREPKKDATALEGPFIESTERWSLLHPEHGPFSLPAGIFQVTYQRDYAKERADEIRRVSD